MPLNSSLPKLDHATYSISLPSDGTKIKFRPFLVKEQKILMIAEESKDPNQMMQAMINIIQNCVIEAPADFNVLKLPMFDIEYIFMQLRSKSIGESVEVGLKCEKCETENKVKINFDNAYVEKPETDLRVIPLTAEVGLKMKYPDISMADDIVKTQNVSDEGDSNNPPTKDTETIFNMIINCIDSIYSADNVYSAENTPRAELEEFVESMSQEHFQKINDFFVSVPTLKLPATFTCSNCGHENKADVEGLVSFF